MYITLTHTSLISLRVILVCIQFIHNCANIHFPHLKMYYWLKPSHILWIRNMGKAHIPLYNGCCQWYKTASDMAWNVRKAFVYAMQDITLLKACAMLWFCQARITFMGFSTVTEGAGGCVTAGSWHHAALSSSCWSNEAIRPKQIQHGRVDATSWELRYTAMDR